MNRFEYAIQAAAAPHVMQLAELAKEFNDAIVQCEAEGQDAHSDPAVLLMGAFISFHTHADVCLMEGYEKLLSQCEHRLASPPVTH